MLPQRLREPGPYNTYTRDGLPPGPICNPGRDALRAALQPAATKYVYFVARGDGSHHFSSTLAEHNRAVAELRRQVAGADAAAAKQPHDDGSDAEGSRGGSSANASGASAARAATTADAQNGAPD